MELLQPLTLSNLQPFIDNPEQLVTQPVGFQIAVANYPATPRRLLEVLLNSPDPQVAEAAQLHVNWAGEMNEGWQEAVDEMLRSRSVRSAQSRQLGQNDRLAVELLKIAPVPEYFLSEWVPADRLIQGLHNPYMPLRYRLKLLERLAQEPTLEPRLQVAESPETPLVVLEQLAGDLELPIRLAVKFNPSCPPQLIELVEGQHAAATDWNTDAEQLAVLGQSRWAWIRLAVAQNPSATAQTLMQLARDAVLKIQLAVAKNPGTPATVLAVLAEHPEKAVLSAVVAHQSATEEILHRLFPTQQYLLIERENLPASILERFFSEAATDTRVWKNYNLRDVLLRQSNTPTWILAQLANVDLEALRAKTLATHQPPPSPEILERWIEDGIRFLADIATHPQVSVEILERLGEYPNPWVRLAVARNLKTPAPLRLQLLSELIHHPEPRIQVEIASDPNTPVSILEQLASAFSTVNLAVDTIRQMLPNASDSLVDAVRTFITNHQSPEEISSRLQRDAVFREPILREWRQLLANLGSLDRATLEALCRQMLPAIGLSGGVPSQDRWLNQYQYPSSEFDLYGLLLWFRLPGNSDNYRNLDVPVALIGNPSTPTALRSQLQTQLTPPPDKAGHYPHDCDMRLALAFNPQTSETQRIEYLQQVLSSDWNHIQKEDIAKNPNTPVSILEQIARQAAQQDNSHTLRLVAENPSAPVDLLKELALNQGKYGVREAALKNLSLDRLTVYEIQLELQAQEETAKAYELMASRSDSPYALAQVLSKGDRNARLTAASSHKTPVHVLEQLAKDPDETIRQVVLQNPNLPPTSLIEFARDSKFEVRIWLARSRHPIPREVLEHLLQDSDARVRTEVANNANTPPDLLRRLVKDRDRNVQLSALQNPNMPGEVLSQVMPQIQDVGEIVRILQGQPGTSKRNSQMPADVLERLSRHPKHGIRCLVATYDTASSTTLERLAFDEHESVRQTVAANPNTPSGILIEIARRYELTIGVSNSIAMRKDAPPEALEFIARKLVAPVRLVAANANTPASALEWLAVAPVRLVAANANTPASALEWLAENEADEGVLCTIVRHPNITLNVWICLACSEAVRVREAVAAQVQCPSDILEMLAGDVAQEVRLKVAANPNTPIDFIDRFSRDESSAIRAAAASNSNLPTATLERLAQDEKVEVRRAVAQNSNTPAPIREALRDLVLQPTTRQTSPTLRSLSRLYNPSTDDLATVLSEYAQSDNAFVRLVTLLHPVTPVEVLQLGTRSQSWLERYAVADNPATPVELRQQLAQDSNRIVRAVANAHL